MKLPVVSGADTIRALRKVGYEIDEQHGSHIILRNTAPPHRRLSVPNQGVRQGYAPSAHSRYGSDR